MSLHTLTENENRGFRSARFPRDSSFPRTRESRLFSAPIRLDTRFRGYDGMLRLFPVVDSMNHLRTHIF